MRYDDAVVADLLVFLFANTNGNVVARKGDETVSGRDPVLISEFTAGDPAARIELFTDEGDVRSIAFVLDQDDKASIGDTIAKFGQPALCFCSADRYVFVYAYDQLTTDYVDGVLEHYEHAVTAIPAPDGVEWQLDDESFKVLEAAGAAFDAAMTRKDAQGWRAEFSGQSNDANIYGALDPDILARPLSFSIGQNSNDKKWKRSESTIGGFINGLTRHAVGEKDGLCFMQGTSVTPERSSKSMQEQFIMGVDIDCGAEMDAALSKVWELGLLCVAYTTHSFNKTRTEEPENGFETWARKNDLAGAEPDDALMRRFMIEHRRIVPEIANTVRYLGREMSGGRGMVHMLEHAPIQKYRLVFFLSKPFDYRKAARTQKDAIDLWKGKMKGLGAILGFPIDNACFDPSRLFYMPRHAKGSEFRIDVVAGNLLDLDVIPVSSTRREAVSRDAFEAAAEQIAGKVGLDINGTSIKRWASDRAATFQIAHLFESEAPDFVRDRQSEDKLTVQCPFEDEHSSGGGAEDKGCFVINAHGEGGDAGFAFSCSHASCAGRDRLDLLCEAIKRDYFPAESLIDDRYIVVTDEAEPVQDRTADLFELKQAIEALTTETPNDEIEKLAKTLGRLNLGKLEEDQLLTQIASATTTPKGVLQLYVKNGKRSAVNEIPTETRIRQMLRTVGRSIPNGTDPMLLDGAFVNEFKRDLVKRLNAYNAKTPTMFSYAKGRFVSAVTEDDVFFHEAEVTHLQNFFETFVSIYELSMEGAIGEKQIPERTLREILVDKDLKLPKLVGFTSLPYFAPDGVLIDRPGWDARSGNFLRPWVGFTIPDVPRNPSPDDVEMALARIREAWGEFPFDDGAGRGGSSSWAHFLAFLLQPFVRSLISGECPAYLVTKPSPGTGASLLISTAITTAHGVKNAKTKTENKADEETKKVITSTFLIGDPYIWIDNVNHKIDSSAFANLITGQVWSDRGLGGNTQLEFDIRLQTVFSGNNPTATSEIMRRFLPIRLDAKRDPLARKFSIPDLPKYIEKNKGELIGALLTLVNSWIMMGQQEFSGTPMASFEPYSRVMGGILECAGVEGFLGNLHLTTGEADDESRGWEAFVQEWADQKGFGAEAKTAKLSDLAQTYVGMMDAPDLGFQPHSEENIVAKRLGLALKKKADSIIKIAVNEQDIEVKIVREQDKKAKTWNYLLDVAEA